MNGSYKKNFVGDDISPNDYKLSADGLILVSWNSQKTKNLDLNLDTRLRVVKVIGEEAFRDCDDLRIVSIPSSVTRIGESAFRGCQRLIRIDIPDIPSSVMSIEEWAFSECISLTRITIPSSVTNEYRTVCFLWL